MPSELWDDLHALQDSDAQSCPQSDRSRKIFYQICIIFPFTQTTLRPAARMRVCVCVRICRRVNVRSLFAYVRMKIHRKKSCMWILMSFISFSLSPLFSMIHSLALSTSLSYSTFVYELANAKKVKVLEVRNGYAQMIVATLPWKRICCSARVRAVGG